MRTVKGMTFYPSDHPHVTESVSELIDQTQQYLSHNRQLVVGIDNERLLIQDSLVEDSDLSDQLINIMQQRKIGSMMIKRGVTEQEIRSFLDLLTTSPGDVLVDEDIQEKYLTPLRKIEIDELDVQYSTSTRTFPGNTNHGASSEKSGDEDQSGSDPDEGEDDSLFPEIESRSEALRELLTSDPEPEMIYEWVSELVSELNLFEDPDPVESGFEAITQLINRTVEKAKEEGIELPDTPAQEFLVQFLIKIGLMGDTPFSSIKDQLGSHLNKLEHDAKEFLLGDAEVQSNPGDKLLSSAQAKSRGLAIAREIHQGSTSMERLSQMIESVAPSGDDFADVISSAVEEISQFTTMTEEQSGARELASLFNALLANTPYQDPAPQVLIADDDVEYDQYLIYLSNLNYFFDLHEDGYEAWRALNADKSYDLLVLEIKIPGKTGLELIEDLASLDEQPAVLVCTKYAQFQDAYEIVTYPKIEFLEKPVQEEEFNEAVRELLPPTKTEPDDSPALYSEEEMERAHDVQDRLLNQPLPEPEQYELSRFHQSSPEIDGDYLDVIPINDDEYLLALAEVFGTGVSASLVMLILRNALHVLLNQFTEPANILIHLNRFITNEIDRPMYTRILLGRFNTSRNTIQFTSAGKFSPLFWNQNTENVSSIDLTGISVGLTGDRRFNEFLQTRSVALNPGDAVLLSSDGIPNVKNEKGDATFGLDRLKSIVRENATTSAEAITEELENQLIQFSGDGTLSNDSSSLAIKSS